MRFCSSIQYSSFSNDDFILFAFKEEEEEEEGTEEIAIHLQNVVGTIALETRLDLVIFVY